MSRSPNLFARSRDQRFIPRLGHTLKLGWRGASIVGPVGRLWGEESADPPPFEGLVTTYEAELRRFLGRKVPLEAVDDLLQEVWVAVWQGLPKYDRRSKLRTWIYGICLHKCHDYYRARRMEPTFVPIDMSPIVDGHAAFERAVAQADTVRRLLAELDEGQRAILELYYYVGLTFKEISEVLDRNLNTVKYHFYRAHSDLIAAGDKEDLL